jgi:C4-dicarboxylate-specific signal transduction histidine kinase
MGDFIDVIVGVVLLFVVLVGVWLFDNRRMARERIEQEEAREAEEERAAEREAKLAELSQEGRLLYQLIGRVDALFEVEQTQARRLASIRLGVSIIAVLMVLGVIAGVLLALPG